MDETKEKKESTPGFSLMRKVLLASIGAAVLAQDELERFVNGLVERGEVAEKDARKLVQELLDKREKIIQEHRAGREGKGGYATKADIEALSTRLADLARKLEELKQA